MATVFRRFGALEDDLLSSSPPALRLLFRRTEADLEAPRLVEALRLTPRALLGPPSPRAALSLLEREMDLVDLEERFE